MFRKLRPVIALALLAALLFSAGCKEQQTHEFVMGYGGLATQVNGYIYFINGAASVASVADKYSVTYGALARMLPDGSMRQIVVPMLVAAYQIVGDEIYLVTANEAGEMEIGVCSLEGTNYRYITKMDKGVFQYVNGYLFFQKNGVLVRTDKRGRGKKTITKDSITSINFDSKHIFYTYVNADGTAGLKKTDHSGKNAQTILDTEAFIMRINNNTLYAVLREDNRLRAIDIETNNVSVAVFTAYDEYIFDFDKNIAYGAGSAVEPGIVATDMSTGDRVELTTDYAANITLGKDWLYYTNQSDNGFIYRVSLDGSKRELFSAAIPLNEPFTIIDNWLYYTSPYERSLVYRVNTETGQRECIGIERT